MSDNLCYNCKKNRAGKPGHMTSFVFQMMEVNVCNIGGFCIECVKNEWIDNFKRNAEDFISVVSGKLKVDWPEYSKHFKMGRFHDQKESFHSILVNLGILSREAKGNWEVVTYGPIGLNPRAHMAYFYFIHKEDAVEFSRLEKARTAFGWEIHHIDEVISEEEVLEVNNKVAE